MLEKICEKYAICHAVLKRSPPIVLTVPQEVLLFSPNAITTAGASNAPIAIYNAYFSVCDVEITLKWINIRDVWHRRKIRLLIWF